MLLFSISCEETLDVAGALPWSHFSEIDFEKQNFWLPSIFKVKRLITRQTTSEPEQFISLESESTVMAVI